MYKACGGESVRNLGAKRVEYIDSSGTTSKLTFQIGDRITRNLAAASQICPEHKAIYLGPGPQYDSYIIDDPTHETICLGGGARTPISIISGVYQVRVSEVYKNKDVNNVSNTESERGEREGTDGKREREEREKGQMVEREERERGLTDGLTPT